MSTDYTITLTDAQETILTAVAAYKGKTNAEYVHDVAFTALIGQAVQDLNDGCKAKISNKTAAEKAAFIGED